MKPQCDVVFQMGSFTSWCNTHESKADTERQCCMTGAIEALEAAERERDELRDQLATVTAERNDWELNARCCHVERVALAKTLEIAQARIAELESYIDKHNQRVLSTFAHTAPPTDWDQETPLGQMLDGLGDEVEP